MRVRTSGRTNAPNHHANIILFREECQGRPPEPPQNYQEKNSLVLRSDQRPRVTAPCFLPTQCCKQEKLIDFSAAVLIFFST
jgi:hypothetical protein